MVSLQAEWVPDGVVERCLVYSDSGVPLKEDSIRQPVPSLKHKIQRFAMEVLLAREIDRGLALKVLDVHRVVCEPLKDLIRAQA